LDTFNLSIVILVLACPNRFASLLVEADKSRKQWVAVVYEKNSIVDGINKGMDFNSAPIPCIKSECESWLAGAFVSGKREKQSTGFRIDIFKFPEMIGFVRSNKLFMIKIQKYL